MPEDMVDEIENPLPNHHHQFGVVTSLRFVGCVVCATESGAAHACCLGMRCYEHHNVHLMEVALANTTD